MEEGLTEKNAYEEGKKRIEEEEEEEERERDLHGRGQKLRKI